MPQENLNKIWNAGKYFEPKPEQNPKPTPDETQLSTVKRKINVAKAFVPQQEDPFRQKVEAVMKGIEEIEPAFASATAGEEEEPASALFAPAVSSNVETIIGTGQNEIGENLTVGESIRVKGDAGGGTGYQMSGGEIYVEGNATGATGHSMSGGEIHVKGDAGKWTGYDMTGGTLRIDGNIKSFDRRTFIPQNKGTIIWKGETIWHNGEFTQVGKELYDRRYYPFAKNRIRIGDYIGYYQ
jgi:hypothetical protein